MRARGFGALDGAALVVATTIGAGIFTVPAYVAALGGSPAVILALWVAGGAMAMAGALSYAELAARLPRGGAEYVYLREAFGPTAGFLSGWTSFVAGFSGAIAAAAVGFERHLLALAPALEAAPPSAIALTLIATFTVVCLTGVGASRLVTNALAVVIVGGVVALVIGARLAPAAAPTVAMQSQGAGALSALVPIFFTYSGWNAAAYVAGEFRDPVRTVPRALILGTALVTVLYVALNAALLDTLSAGAVARSIAPVHDTAELALGAVGGRIVSILVLVALASSVCAMVVTGPRIYREMARDGVLPAVFARSRGGNGAPAFAVVAQSVWSGALVLTGTFEEIVTYTGFAIMLFSGAAVAGLFVLRRRDGAPATYRVPGYPIVPLMFVAAAAVIAFASVRYAPGPSLAGVLLIALGYGVLRLRMTRAAARPAPARAR